MWIVALALRRPYTFVVMALLIIILTPLTISRTPVDIFPEINIPVVSTNSERGITVTVNDVEHQESQSLSGIAVIKVFFRPSVNISMAVTQVTAICQTVLRGLPAGTTPPLVITYTASSTPIVQLGLSSKTLPEQQLFDLGQNFLRTQLTTVQGAGTPYPFGGKPRQIQVDLDTAKLQAYGLAPADIVNAVAAQWK
jgi:multidrug efflux pump subunit AcrB